MEFQALVTNSVEVHLLCHVTLLYCQVDPNPKPKAKSKAKKSLLPLPILPLMWQPLLILTNVIHPTHCRSCKFPRVWFQPKGPSKWGPRLCPPTCPRALPALRCSGGGSPAHERRVNSNEFLGGYRREVSQRNNSSLRGHSP